MSDEKKTEEETAEVIDVEEKVDVIPEENKESVEVEPATDSDDQTVSVSKEDLALILKKQNEIQNAFTQIGLMEVKKIELVNKITAAKRIIDMNIQDTLEKVGIDKDQINQYGIDPRTGIVFKREDIENSVPNG